MIFMVFEANKNACRQKWFAGIELSKVVCIFDLFGHQMSSDIQV